MGPLERARLHYSLSSLFDRFDTVVVDGGPGLEGALRAATIGASAMAVVAVPEPAALSDAYALVKLAHLSAPHLPLGLVVNRIEADGEAEAVHERLELASRRFLGRELRLLGAVPEDSDLRVAVRTPGRLLEGAGDAIADAVRVIADRFETLAPAEAAA
jgi:flagellar biosynthesis protein FlhG